MKIFIQIVYSLIACSLFNGSVFAGQILVGVLEEPQCKRDHAISVRVMFAKNESGWQSLSKGDEIKDLDLRNISWLIANKGRKIGILSTVDPGFETPYRWTYARDRLLNIAPGQKIPQIKNQSQLFSGWCQAPQNRPLSLITTDKISDPDGWTIFIPNQSLIETMFIEFKKHVGKTKFCPEHPTTYVPFNYTSAHLEASNCYKDKRGRKLVSLSLKTQFSNCDGVLDVAWDSHLFLVSEQIIYLGNGLTFLDAGDYDANGKSELLFWFSAYNNDGYVLFSSELKRVTDYLWSYH